MQWCLSYWAYARRKLNGVVTRERKRKREKRETRERETERERERERLEREREGISAITFVQTHLDMRL